MNALEIKGFKKRYKNFELKDINLSLEEGAIMGFIGPNGAGKSTTIKAVLNQIHRDGGEIRLWGKDNIRCEMEVKDRIGVVQDEGHFYEHMSMRRMKNLIAPFYSGWDETAYQKWLSEFRLDEKQKISSLSKGMRMKFAIALALSHGADLLIMDEPTAGLDPMVRDNLLDILRRLMQDEKKSVFFSTHITSDLDKIADRIVLINNGRILLEGGKDELLDTHALVKGPNSALDAGAEGLFINVRRGEYGFDALAEDREAVRHRLDGVVMERPSVEDLIIYYVRRDEKCAG